MHSPLIATARKTHMTHNNNEFKITRTFDVPRELMWKAWTESKMFGQWFGPTGFKSMVKTMDLKPGGILHSCLKSPDGAEMWAKFVYREVTPPLRLVWEHSFSNKDAGITRHPGHESWPLKMVTTVVFDDIGNKTKITLTWVTLEASESEQKTFNESMDGMTQGWTGTFNQLDDFFKMTPF